jgi:cytochrome c553
VSLRSALDRHQTRLAGGNQQSSKFTTMREEMTMRSMQRGLAVCVALAAMAGASGRVNAQDTAGDQNIVRRAIHVCTACHGEGGRSTTAAIPSLAGQMRQYTITQLQDFRSQTRAEAGTRAYMWGVSALLDDAAISGLADYYAAQAPATGKAGPQALVKAGRKIFVDGIPARGVRACASCHGNGAEGAAGFPRLAGQRADYVYSQLKVFSTKLRPHGVVMQNETKSMTASEFRAVAAYLQSL